MAVIETTLIGIVRAVELGAQYPYIGVQGRRDREPYWTKVEFERESLPAWVPQVGERVAVACVSLGRMKKDRSEAFVKLLFSAFVDAEELAAELCVAGPVTPVAAFAGSSNGHASDPSF